MNPSSSAPAHPLDNVVWSALTGRQSSLARGRGLARRFDPAYSGFAALAEPTSAAMAAFAEQMAPGDVATLVSTVELHPGESFELLGRLDLVQMIGPPHGEAADPARFDVLSEADHPRMRDLVRRTEPGPFFERTPEMGRFVGLRVDGRIAAMAGERMRVEGHTEVSAVCTDIDWRGRGLARDLILLVSQTIIARGETPFLHVLAGNTTAIALYRRLGFSERAAFRLAQVRRR